MTAIPGGTSTYSKVRFPGPVRRAAWGSGCWIGTDDRRYIDTVAGLGCISLGYRDERVDAAIAQQMEYGISFSLPTGVEENVAQHLLRFLNWDGQVRFSKNGADVTNLAVRLARAHTGRDGIVAMDYHGHDDWCQIQSAGQNAGIPERLWGIVNSRAGGGLSEVAAVILEPIPSDGITHRTTDDLCKIATWARERGALLIYDCMITGMRLNRCGWPEDAPEPDLACYGKAMGNGMPLSALVGPEYLMDRITDDVFFSTTFGGECLSLAAADAVLTVYEDQKVLSRLIEAGVRLTTRLVIRAEQMGLCDELEIASYASRPFHKWRTQEQADTFTEAMLEEGILYQGYHNLMLASCEDEPLAIIERAYDVALEKVAAL